MASHQTLSEIYTSECAALQMHPNSFVRKYLDQEEARCIGPAHITQLDFSPTLLGKKGVLPLLTIFRQCNRLHFLGLKGTGLNDFAIMALTTCLTQHPSICIVHLQKNELTGDSIPSLRAMINVWLLRVEKSSSPLAAVKKRNDETEFEVRLDCGAGIFENVVFEFGAVRRTAMRAGEDGTAAAPLTVLSADAPCTAARGPTVVEAAEGTTPKHTMAFAKTLKQIGRRLQQQTLLNSTVNRKLRANADKWLVLGVYFSTTYTEFCDEMQLIHTTIIPRLNCRLRAHKIHLVPLAFHTLEDESFRPSQAMAADGTSPIDTTRLPLARRSYGNYAEEVLGRKAGTVCSEAGAMSAEVRDQAVRAACDIFVALHSDMYSPSCHAVDWNALSVLPEAIPSFVYQRTATNVPIGMQQLFDYKAKVHCDIASRNHVLHGGSSTLPRQKDLQLLKEQRVEEMYAFRRRVRAATQPCMRHAYNATFANVSSNGTCRFKLEESFAATLSQDLYTAALHYGIKRYSGVAGRPTTFTYEGIEVPTIPKQNWSDDEAHNNPFAHLEAKLVVDEERRNAVVFKKDMSQLIAHPVRDDVGGGEDMNVDDESPPGRGMTCIWGAKGSGRTTQIRGTAAAVFEDRSVTSFIVTHSVTAGKRTMQAIMVGILQQLYTNPLGALLDSFSSDDEEVLCQAFCKALKEATQLVPRYTKLLWIFIDDDDAVVAGNSFAEAFQASRERMQRLIKSSPHTSHLRVVYTACRRPPPNDDLTAIQTPLWDELEAADMFVSHLIGIDPVPDSQLMQCKRAAQTLVLDKKHGLKPLYLYLAAKECSYYNEGVSMQEIAQALPHSVEELIISAARSNVPKDFATVFDAIVAAPEPPEGGLLLHAVFPLRQEPNFSQAASRRTWFTARRFGLVAPPLSSAQILMYFLANFIHLLRGCSRSRNRGFVTQRRSALEGSVWRSGWTFAGRTIFEALAQKPKDRRAASSRVAEYNPWESVMSRVAYILDYPYTFAGLCNAFDPAQFFSTPHPTFALLQARKFDELRTLLERFLFLLCSVNPNVSNAEDASGQPSRASLTQIKHKIMEARMSSLGADPTSIPRTAIGMTSEYMTYFSNFWHVLQKHRAFLYSCPQYAPPLLRKDIEQAIAKDYPCAHIRHDSSFSFYRKAYETSLTLTSVSQDTKEKEYQAPTAPKRVGTNVEPAIPAGGPRLFTYLDASVVSKAFVTMYRSIVNAKPHDVTPMMASPQTTLAPADHPNGGASFGYVGVVVMQSAAEEAAMKRGIKSGPSSTFLSLKAHTNAISCLTIVETRFAIRIATAAYFETEIAVAALVIAPSTPRGTKLQLVARLQLNSISRTLITFISMSPITESQVPPTGDDGQRAPMLCCATKQALTVFDAQKFGHDNLFNKQGNIEGHVYTGHENKVALHGFSPAGAKMFSIDCNGHCFVWGSPESPCSGTILAVTDFGAPPLFARFIDHEVLLLVTGRSITLWNSSNSQVSQLLSNPCRSPFDANFAMLHFLPPAYVFGAPEDTDQLNLPPHVKVTRLLEQLREKKHPTVTYMSFDGVSLLDVSDGSLKVFRREHIPPQTEFDCEKPAPLFVLADPAQRCQILPNANLTDDAGNKDIEKWKWSLGGRTTVAIDTNNNVVKVFDMVKGEQVPLFYGIPVAASAAAATGQPFARLDDVVCCGENEERIVVAQDDGSVHIATYVRGPMFFPCPSMTSM